MVTPQWVPLTAKHWSYIPVFLDSTQVFTGPAKTSIWTMYVCALYPIPQLYIQTDHKLACWYCFKRFQMEIKKKFMFSHNFLSPLLSLCTLTTAWFQGYASRTEPCFLPSRSLCNDEWFVMEILCDLSTMCLLSCYVNAPLWIYRKLNWQTVLLYFLVTIRYKWLQVPRLVIELSC